MSESKSEAQNKLSELRKTFKLGTYKHYKGKFYTVFALSVQENSGEVLVHYYSHENKTRWTRTIGNFTDHVENSLYAGDRFVYHSGSGSLLLLEAAGFDDMVSSLKFFNRILGN